MPHRWKYSRRGRGRQYINIVQYHCVVEGVTEDLEDRIVCESGDSIDTHGCVRSIAWQDIEDIVFPICIYGNVNVLLFWNVKY